jgi:hypothetical protein
MAISQDLPIGSEVHAKGFRQTNRLSGRGSKLRSTEYKVGVTATQQYNPAYKKKISMHSVFRIQ